MLPEFNTLARGVYAIYSSERVTTFINKIIRKQKDRVAKGIPLF